ncbi:MAG: hypothetical protein ACRDFC_04055 [Ignavibacteria bacterium]
MKKKLLFRSWFYLRIGWATYFALIVAMINTLTVTYYLLVNNVTILQGLFPSFLYYITIITIIAMPLLTLVGYAHFRRSQAYGAEAEVTIESNPYYYKSLPGWSRDVQWPLFLKFSEILVKISKNEKLNENDLTELTELQNKIKTLIEGGYIGQPRKPKKIIDDKMENK